MHTSFFSTADCVCSFSNGTGGQGGSGSITFHISENDASGKQIFILYMKYLL